MTHVYVAATLVAGVLMGSFLALIAMDLMRGAKTPLGRVVAGLAAVLGAALAVSAVVGLYQGITVI